SAIVRYEVETHGGGRLAPWLGDSTARRLGVGPKGWNGGEGQATAIVATFGVRYVGRWDNAAPGASRIDIATVGERAAIPVSGFDYVLSIRGTKETPETEDTVLAALVSREARSIRVIRRGQLLIEVPLDTLIARAMRVAGRRRFVNLPQLSLVSETQNARARARVYLRQLTVLDRSPAPPGLTAASGDVLVKLR
ncbi:MAG: hypothetical protein ACHQU8_08900, partial [Gemmatimonadales bacterium]